jgi:3'-phosphoadenosine 5'-phosphosulfate (PAPS) 3'-phosphatase
MNSPTTQALAEIHGDAVCSIVLQAGEEILKVYHTEFAVQTKQDESPLTQADLGSARRHCCGLADVDTRYSNYLRRISVTAI